MGFLDMFSKPTPTLFRLPSGSLTVDREGDVLAATLPSSFPTEMVAAITEQVLAGFREAAAAHLPFSELVINYPSLRITARELRGGAVIFLSPRTPGSPVNQQ